MPSAFVPNRSFPRQLAATSEYRDGLAEAAEPAAQHARDFAPVQTGAYRDSIGIVIAGQEVYLSAKDWKANFIEYGTVDTPAFAPLRRGVRAGGLRLVEE